MRSWADGADMHRLAVEHRSRLEARLAAGLIDGLGADLATMFPGDKKVQGDFGDGLTMRPKVVTSVAAALAAIEHGFNTRPAEARQAGLLPDDLAEVKEALTEILGEDDVQETKKDTAKETTAKRNATQARVEQAMEAIVGVAVLVLRGEPRLVEKFRGLLPTKVGKKKVFGGVGTAS